MRHINDYSFLKYTDDVSEQIAIGKRIVAENPRLYVDTRLAMIRGLLKAGGAHKSLTEDELLYKSIYDFWVWGFSADELVFYHLIDADSEEKSTYISDQNRFNYYYHLNSKKDEYMLQNKYVTYSLMPEAYKRDVMRIVDQTSKAEFMEFVGKHPEFCLKPSSSSCGKGVRKVSLADYENADEMFHSLLRELGQGAEPSEQQNGNYLVLEELIIQADVVGQFHASSVNGVRLTTLHVNDKVTFFTPWLKVGNNNAFVGTAAQGGFIAGIDPDTGIVCTDGISENGNSYPVHPYSDKRFCGTELPDWSELLRMAADLARKVPMFGYIGWDFVPTKDKGWCVMEANFGGQMLGQMIYHRGMKKEFEEIIGWRSDKEFWWS